MEFSQLDRKGISSLMLCMCECVGDLYSYARVRISIREGTGIRDNNRTGAWI